MAAVADHGGSLERARALFPGAPEPFIDLSTGINPHSYPLIDLPASAFARLPEPGRDRLLREIAASAYGAPDAAHVVAAPGTQILLPMVYALARQGSAAVLGPTYAEHARAAAIAGHAVVEAEELASLAAADLAIVVNPNNPDGRVTPRTDLLALAGELGSRGGMLVVDEAFMDVGPRSESLACDVAKGGIVVLRSFGKFFGLAGLRLGFALADRATAARLEASLGPWAVSGPALEYGIAALADGTWQEAMRHRLAADADRLDLLLSEAGLAVSGGTSLFRILQHRQADVVFRACGEVGILLRAFDGCPDALRFGLPGGEEEWRRLAEALSAWRRRENI